MLYQKSCHMLKNVAVFERPCAVDQALFLQGIDMKCAAYSNAVVFNGLTPGKTSNFARKVFELLEKDLYESSGIDLRKISRGVESEQNSFTLQLAYPTS